MLKKVLEGGLDYATPPPPKLACLLWRWAKWVWQLCSELEKFDGSETSWSVKQNGQSSIHPSSLYCPFAYSFFHFTSFHSSTHPASAHLTIHLSCASVSWIHSWSYPSLHSSTLNRPPIHRSIHYRLSNCLFIYLETIYIHSSIYPSYIRSAAHSSIHQLIYPFIHSLML